MAEHATKLLSSFGRRKGRNLRATKQGLVETLLPKLGVDDWVEDPPNPLWLEIGFGGGEHIAHQAALHPEVSIIGCDPYVNGFAELLKNIDKNNIGNIRIFTDDARLLVEKLPDACLARVYILYPDPWPKMRHNKRRLVSKHTLDMLSRVLKRDGLLRLATDHADYATWMLERLLAHKDFSWTAKNPEDWLTPWPEWISTRYEQKALAGRPTYLEFTKA